MIRDVEFKDSIAIADIYNHYIQNSTCTFEEERVSEREMCSRITAVIEHGMPWLVYEHEGQVVGYCYAKPWNTRSAYRFTVESSVYVDANSPVSGVGTLLYQHLFLRLDSLDIKNVMSVITLPNDQSVAFHNKMGMEQVGHFKRMGFKFGKWLDVGYWQKELR